MGKIIKETAHILWEEQQPLYMQVSTVKLLNRLILKQFGIFLTLLVGLDGKHVCIICLSDSGSMFLNYNKFFPLVLHGLVDANDKFITIDFDGF